MEIYYYVCYQLHFDNNDPPRLYLLLVLIYQLIQYMNRLRSAPALIPVSAQARCKPYVNTVARSMNRTRDILYVCI